jgi:protein N-terminal methyltransferase
MSEEKQYTLADIEKLLKKRMKKIDGSDTNNKDYKEITALWKYIFPEFSRPPNKKSKTSHDGSANCGEWYSKANEYWESEENCPISDDGVLGGYGALTEMDVRDSNRLLDSIPGLTFEVACDCGAGIGRVTKNFLLPRFHRVDLVEQSRRLLNAAPRYVGVDQSSERLGLIEVGMQDFVPEPNRYDVIWIQWVIGHLHDIDFIQFFRRCAKGLKDNGVIVLKDNCIMVETHAFNLDLDDNSVCRNIIYFRLLFELSGVEIVREQLQTDFPEELYPVMMFVLRAPRARIANVTDESTSI